MLSMGRLQAVIAWYHQLLKILGHLEFMVDPSRLKAECESSSANKWRPNMCDRENPI